MKGTRALVLIGLMVFGALAIGESAYAYYGKNSTEAWLEFEGEIELPWAVRTPLKLAGLNDEKSAAGKRALEATREQVNHLIGTFQSKSFQRQAGGPGVLSEEHKYEFHFKKAERVILETDEGIDERAKLTYRFKSKVVFHKKFFKNRSTTQIPLRLPYAPDMIYDLGLVNGKNRCTDEHYNSDGDFFYFWDPAQKGCPQEAREAVIEPFATLTEIPNTSLTYPNYEKLYGNNGNGDDFEIFVFFGYYKDIYDLKKPPRGDLARQVLRDFESSLEKRGFKRVQKQDRFRLRTNGTRMQGINFYRIYKFDHVTIRVLLADTAISSDDGTFHHYFRDALKNSDIVMYDGHSGLGASLDLELIGQISMSKDKYQIFFFNGCSTYPYFNGSYFERKGGQKNLEIILSGLPTLSTTSGPNHEAFLGGFTEQKTLSYQRILQNLERSNGSAGTYLFGVVGDEDNTWVP